MGDHPDPLAWIRQTTSGLSPAVAADLARWLQELDDRIRQVLRLDRAEQLLPGVACPACSTRLLRLQTAAPVSDRTVVCGAGCTCSGPGCPCGMETPGLGVRHIWPAETPFLADAQVIRA